MQIVRILPLFLLLLVEASFATKYKPRGGEEKEHRYWVCMTRSIASGQNLDESHVSCTTSHFNSMTEAEAEEFRFNFDQIYQSVYNSELIENPDLLLEAMINKRDELIDVVLSGLIGVDPSTYVKSNMPLTCQQALDSKSNVVFDLFKSL